MFKNNDISRSKIRVFLRHLGTRFGSLESEKIIIGSLESEKSGPYMSIPGT